MNIWSALINNCKLKTKTNDLNKSSIKSFDGEVEIFYNGWNAKGEYNKKAVYYKKLNEIINVIDVSFIEL